MCGAGLVCPGSLRSLSSIVIAEHRRAKVSFRLPRDYPMIQTLTLKNFKSFSEPKGHNGQWQGASTDFGGLSLIIGTNASGKSNIRDGLRFIHGISRGYSLSEIIGEKYVGGAIQWEGIRGGVRETVTRNGDLFDTQFTISVQTNLADVDGGGTTDYSITVDVGHRNQAPFVVRESLSLSGSLVFETIGPAGPRHVLVSIPINSAEVSVGNEQPTILPLSYDDTFDIPKHCRAFLRTIRSVRFLDLDPNSLRRPSIPGQTVLGDKGENLSSVLQAICSDASAKESLIEWTKELTPLDVVDLKFPEVSLEGKIQCNWSKTEAAKSPPRARATERCASWRLRRLFLEQSPPVSTSLKKSKTGFTPTARIC